MAREAVIVSSPPHVRLELRPFVLPADLLPNRANRLHWRTTSRLRRRLRGDAGLALASAMASLPSRDLDAIFAASLEGPIGCRLTVAYEREQTQGTTGMRRYRQHADDDAVIAAFKGGFDAMQDVYLVANDKQLRHVPPIQRNDPEGIGFIVVELWQDGRTSSSRRSNATRIRSCMR